MRTSLRVMLTVSATVFATVAAAAYSQDTMKNPHDPLKPGREPAEDGGIAVRSGKRLHGSGHEIDDNIMQPGKNSTNQVATSRKGRTIGIGWSTSRVAHSTRSRTRRKKLRGSRWSAKSRWQAKCDVRVRLGEVASQQTAGISLAKHSAGSARNMLTRVCLST